jgi:sucrose-6-phosphate hydrolase SacC (GH32 family)
MAVYDESTGSQDVAFYASSDLKKWEYQSRIAGFFECPDLYSLLVDGDPKQVRWVLSAADGKYVLGQFDGRQFVKDSGKHQVWYGNFYAAQTYDSAPDGRRIQIGWGKDIIFPGMPFNQQMTVPCELTLRTTAEGLRLFVAPVKEIEALYAAKHSWKGLTLPSAEDPLSSVRGQLFDLQTEFRPASAEQVTFTVRGVPVAYDVKMGQVSCQGKTAPLKPGEVVRLRILVDRGSVEVFGNEGQVTLSAGVLLAPEQQKVSLSVKGGTAKFDTLTVQELKSAWK